MTGQQIALAIEAFAPFLRLLIKQVEGAPASSKEKHEAVAEGAEWIWAVLQEQRSIKEINDVPWDAVAPLIVPAGVGIISMIVGLFNRLGVWISDLFDGDSDQ